MGELIRATKPELRVAAQKTYFCLVGLPFKVDSCLELRISFTLIIFCLLILENSQYSVW